VHPAHPARPPARPPARARARARTTAAGRASTWPTPPGRHIVDLVLATDVTTTMPYVKNFEGWLVSADQKTEITAPRAMQLLIKAADISNPTRALAVYEKWVTGVMEEFFRQGDAERELGLPYSMNCDRNTVNVNKCQVRRVAPAACIPHPLARPAA